MFISLFLVVVLLRLWHRTPQVCRLTLMVVYGHKGA
jgi:hypothetical protein